MPDPATIISLLSVAAATAGQAAIEEATKDAWSAAKTAIREVFGRRGTDAVEKLETAPSVNEGKADLERLLSDLREDESQELTPVLQGLQQALLAEPAAVAVAKERGIRLDLDVAGNVTIERLDGADTLEVRAKSGGEFSLRDVTMSKDNPRGN